MDDRNIVVPGARPVVEVLSHDPFFRLFGRGLSRPLILGFVIALLAIAIVLLGPSSDSRFIYTDF